MENLKRVFVETVMCENFYYVQPWPRLGRQLFGNDTHKSEHIDEKTQLQTAGAESLMICNTTKGSKMEFNNVIREEKRGKDSLLCCSR